MMYKGYSLVLFLSFISILLISCSKDDNTFPSLTDESIYDETILKIEPGKAFELRLNLKELGKSLLINMGELPDQNSISGKIHLFNDLDDSVKVENIQKFCGCITFSPIGNNDISVQKELDFNVNINGKNSYINEKILLTISGKTYTFLFKGFRKEGIKLSTEKFVIYKPNSGNSFVITQFLTGYFHESFSISKIESDDPHCKITFQNASDGKNFKELQTTTYSIKYEGILSDIYSDGCAVIVYYNVDGKEDSAKFLISGTPLNTGLAQADPPVIRMSILKPHQTYEKTVRVYNDQYKTEIQNAKTDENSELFDTKIDIDKSCVDISIKTPDKKGFYKTNLIVDVRINEQDEKLIIPCSFIVMQ
ncbi:MAG: hypothetical protein AB1656_18105 [Candidatus Omnitrophota bacterium]